MALSEQEKKNINKTIELKEKFITDLESAVVKENKDKKIIKDGLATIDKYNDKLIADIGKVITNEKKTLADLKIKVKD